jgi:hypothetical protein
MNQNIYEQPRSDLDLGEPDDFDHEPLNPWFSIWIKPRRTIAQIVREDPTSWVLFLAAMAGITQILDNAVMRSLGDQWEWHHIVIFAVIAGPIAGIIGLFLISFLLRVTGAWFGGEGSPEDVRAAYAWSGVPILWIMPLWVPQLLIFGQEMFTTATPMMDANPSLWIGFMVLAVIELIAGIWGVVVYLKCLGQVQAFSAWVALANTIVAYALLLLPLIGIALLVIL